MARRKKPNKVVYQVTVSGQKEFGSQAEAKEFAKKMLDETAGDLTIEIEKYLDDDDE